MPQSAAVGVRALSLSRSFGLPGKSKKDKTEVGQEPWSSHTATSIPPLGSMDKIRSKELRKSFHLPGRSSSPVKSQVRASPKVPPNKPVNLSIQIESPPLICYGNPAQSTGALLSGILALVVTDPNASIVAFTMVLQARVVTEKPVAKDCPDCITKVSEINSWNFLSEPTTFKQGKHHFPFSYLLKGHLPATSHGVLGNMEYVLRVKATTSLDDRVYLDHPLILQRALMPGPDRNSERVFPPTNLRALVVTPSVIHPIGAFPVQMRLSGLVDTPMKEVQRRWRVRKINWRIDEHCRMVSAACAKHAAKVGGEGKGVLHEDTRTVGSDEIKSGWKTDFDTPGGLVEIEFTAAIDAHRRPVCDVESSNGLSSSHLLILEIIVMEEQTPLKGPRYATPTGSARVLRVNFKLVLTERAGMGISWDEEMPPMYEDVERSPPGYAKMEDFRGELADLPIDEELEQMQNQASSSASP